MLELERPDRELHGWKDIAGYLGVSIRTAQTLEKDQALPVSRGVGSKPQVSARASDLDSWKDQHRHDSVAGTADSLHPGITAPSTSDAILPPVKPKYLSRRNWLVGGVIAAVGLGGLGVVRLLWHRRQPVAAARIDGSTLIALDPDGRELWRYKFTERLGRYPSSRLGPPYCLIADLDGKGMTELLVVVLTASSSYGPVVCFGPGGDLRWRHAAGKAVVDSRGHQYLPPFGVVALAAIPARAVDPGLVVIVGAHNWSFPCQVAVLDGRTGRSVGEFWHRGHLNHIAIIDLEGKGKPQLLLGGVNDAPEYKRATLLCFDPRHVSGASRDQGGNVYFHGMSAGTEKTIIFFPRTEVSRYEEFNRVTALESRGGRIFVAVAEGITETDPAAIYEFDYSFRITNVALSGTLVQRFKEWQEAGKLPAESPESIAQRLRAGVEVVHRRGPHGEEIGSLGP
jgi:hypothetical protein